MIDKLFDWFESFILGFCKTCMAILIVCISIVVFGRTLFNWTPRWGEELALMAMVWFALLSASLSIRDDRHIRITMIEYILPEKASKALDMLVLMFICVYSIIIIYTGYQFTVMSVGTTMPGLVISRAFLSASAPAAGFAILIACVGKARKVLCQPKQ